MELELKEYDRKPFGVIAVEVTLTNIEQVAAWCNGELSTENVRMLGTTVTLPTVKLKGQGRDKDRVFVAQVGCFVVDHKGSFRMYKPAQFREMFNERRKLEVKREDLERVSVSTGIPIFQSEED